MQQSTSHGIWTGFTIDQCSEGTGRSQCNKSNSGSFLGICLYHYSLIACWCSNPGLKTNFVIGRVQRWVLNTAPSRFHVKLISTTQYWHFPDTVAQNLQPTIRCERYRSLQCTDTTKSILKVLFVRTYCKLYTCVNKTFTTRKRWCVEMFTEVSFFSFFMFFIVLPFAGYQCKQECFRNDLPGLQVIKLHLFQHHLVEQMCIA